MGIHFIFTEYRHTHKNGINFIDIEMEHFKVAAEQ